jgi:hypothetical protein
MNYAVASYYANLNCELSIEHCALKNPLVPK